MLYPWVTVYLLLLCSQEVRPYFASPRIPKPKQASGSVDESEWDALHDAIYGLCKTQPHPYGCLNRLVDPTKPVTWRNRQYFWHDSLLELHLDANETVCKAPYSLAAGLSFDTSGPSHHAKSLILSALGKPREINWACPARWACCGLDCCVEGKREDSDDALKFLFIVGFVVLFALGGTLKERCDQWKDTSAVLPEKDAGRPFSYTYEPPLLLDVGVDNSYFDPRCNVDFRASIGQNSFRGGARYIPPSGSYRYALAVVDRYPDGNAWLGNINALGEWPVAYHGTSLENISGIIKNGFDLEQCVRCTYGKGIYCAPDPKVALCYSTAYCMNGRWYKIVLQLRVSPTLKNIAFTEDRDEYWIVPNPEHVRPYGICLYDVTR